MKPDHNGCDDDPHALFAAEEGFSWWESSLRLGSEGEQKGDVASWFFPALILCAMRA